MATDPSPSVRTQPGKITVRYVEATMAPEVRAAANHRHTRTTAKYREVKGQKKEALAEFTLKLDTLDKQALSLEMATLAKDGDVVSLPMACLEQPTYREERKAWALAIYRIDEDPLTGEEVRVFEKWEELPEDLLYLNQGTLPFDGKQPPPGGGAGGGGAPGSGKPGHDPLRDVEFPEDEEGEDEPAAKEPPPGPVQPGHEKPKGRGGKKGPKK